MIVKLIEIWNCLKTMFCNRIQYSRKILEFKKKIGIILEYADILKWTSLGLAYCFYF